MPIVNEFVPVVQEQPRGDVDRVWAWEVANVTGGGTVSSGVEDDQDAVWDAAWEALVAAHDEEVKRLEGPAGAVPDEVDAAKARMSEAEERYFPGRTRATAKAKGAADGARRAGRGGFPARGQPDPAGSAQPKGCRAGSQ